MGADSTRDVEIAGGMRDLEQVMARLRVMLLEEGHISGDGMEELEHRVKWLDESLDRIVLKEKLVPEDTLLDLLAGIAGVPVIRMAETRIEPEALDLVPARVVSHYGIMPVAVHDGAVTFKEWFGYARGRIYGQTPQYFDASNVGSLPLIPTPEPGMVLLLAAVGCAMLRRRRLTHGRG